MTASNTGGLPAGALPGALLARLHADGGGDVDGAYTGALDSAPDVSGLAPARQTAIIAAWSGACLHAGTTGAIGARDPDLALLAGDWCFSHALQVLAQEDDLDAIGVLSRAIGQCAIGVDQPNGAGLLAPIWAAAADELRAL